MQRIVVIGAGVAGSALAFRLAQTGQAVTLIDRAEPGWGTTGSSFAWTNANTKTPEDYFALNVAGMQAWRDLRDELGNAPWLGEGGNLVWVTGDDASELEARVARLRSWGYPAEWLSRADAAALEPNLRLEHEVEQAAYFPAESWVDGPAFARAMAAAASTHGATIRFACEVTAIERDGGRVSGVRLADGVEPSPSDRLTRAARLRRVHDKSIAQADHGIGCWAGQRGARPWEHMMVASPL